jgi:hypothetical protein
MASVFSDSEEEKAGPGAAAGGLGGGAPGA